MKEGIKISSPTVIMDERFDQLTAVQLVVLVRVVHLKVMELQLLFAHLARIDWHLCVFLDVPGRKEFRLKDCHFLDLKEFPDTYCLSWSSMCPGLKPAGAW